MASTLRILADDLSGAADCAAAFTSGGAVRLALHEGTSPETRLAVDLDTRWRTEAEARERFARAARAAASDWRTGPLLLYQKVDSTLRGHVAAELAAMLEALDGVRLAIVAPAFPAQGRTLIEGRPHVDGRPLAGWDEDLAQRLARALQGRARVSALAAGAALPPDGDTTREMLPQVVVADASHQTHLAALAAAISRRRGPVLLVGSSGFARVLSPTPARTMPLPLVRGPALIVVGSFAQRSRAQADAFAAAGLGRTIAVAPEGDAFARAGASAASALAQGESVLVHFTHGPAHGAEGSRAAVAALAAALVPALRTCALLVLTGGDTARAMLEALAIDALEVRAELMPGIPVCTVPGRDRPVVVLKAGGFGDNGLLASLAAAHAAPLAR